MFDWAVVSSAIGARIVATARSDFANQVNNAFVFPVVPRALLDLRVKQSGKILL